ncbi:MAG: hypothetical protein U0414_35930 [Polyangiaceae bacterium]
MWTRDCVDFQHANAQTKVKPAPGSVEAENSNMECACGGGPMIQCVPGR